MPGVGVRVRVGVGARSLVAVVAFLGGRKLGGVDRFEPEACVVGVKNDG
jgi:hypothetical protein